MHVYGDAGEVVFDFGDGLAVRTSVESATKGHGQIGCAIREAEHQQFGQARLFTPPAPAAVGATV